MDVPVSLQVFDKSLEAFQDYSSHKSAVIVKKHLPSAIGELEYRIENAHDETLKKILGNLIGVARGADLEPEELIEWNRSLQAKMLENAPSYGFRRRLKKYLQDPEDIYELLKKAQGVHVVENMLNGLLDEAQAMVKARYRAGVDVEIDKRNLTQIVLLRKYIVPAIAEESMHTSWGKGQRWAATAVSILAAAAAFKYTGVPLPIVPAAINPRKLPRAAQIMAWTTLVMFILFIIVSALGSPKGGAAVLGVYTIASTVVWFIFSRVLKKHPPTVEPEPESATVYGRILDRRRVGLRNVQVKYRAPDADAADAELGETTDHTGRYSFDVDTGTYTITAELNGYQTETRDAVDLVPGENEINFRMRRTT